MILLIHPEKLTLETNTKDGVKSTILNIRDKNDNLIHVYLTSDMVRKIIEMG